jgi:16S rRNA (cytidine1402-2'-O)-methyltransferase
METEPEGRTCPERRWVVGGALYVVGTPIGNLSDMAPRALAVLREVDGILAEDTRTSGPWLRREGVTAPIQSYHAHSPEAARDAAVARLASGEALALVSDAGLPGVSDPGQRLVARAWEAGCRVVPVPGPNAALTAFQASGFSLPMTLWGFLAARGRARRTEAQRVVDGLGTQVLYEAPHRIRELVELLHELTAPVRPLMIAREMTKLHEELWRGTVADAVQRVGETGPQGEYTVVLGPAPTLEQSPPDWDAVLKEVDALVSQGVPLSAACREVGSRFDVSRREVYRRMTLRV